jgi:hypothetical protein
MKLPSITPGPWQIDRKHSDTVRGLSEDEHDSGQLLATFTDQAKIGELEANRTAFLALPALLPALLHSFHALQTAREVTGLAAFDTALETARAALLSAGCTE